MLEQTPASKNVKFVLDLNQEPDPGLWLVFQPPELTGFTSCCFLFSFGLFFSFYLYDKSKTRTDAKI